jgi:N-acetylmuramoyl-L-alanine amidase
MQAVRILPAIILLLTTFLCAPGAAEKSKVPVRPGTKASPAPPQIPKAASKPGDKKEPAPSKAAPSAAPTPKVEWKQVYHKGHAWVPVEQVAGYYDMPAPKTSGDSIVLENKIFRLEMTRGQRRVRLNGWTFYFSYSVSHRYGNTIVSVFDVRNVLDPVMRPNDRRDPALLKTVVIDPACGGKATGIKSPYIAEKDLTLDVALQLREKLSASGLKVLLTRTQDAEVSAEERQRLAKSVTDEGIYISLRASTGSGNTRGFETSTLPPAGTPATNEDDDTDRTDLRLFPGNINDRESLALAVVLQSGAVTALKTLDLGIKRHRFEEIRDLDLPAVVCRLGYLSHREEAQKLGTAEYRAAIAQSLHDGVLRYAKYLGDHMQERLEEDRKRPLSFGPITTESGLESGGIKGEKTVLEVPLTAAEGAKIDRSKLEVQLYLFEQQDDGHIEVTTADPPTVEWVSVLPDWKQTRTEHLRATWIRPPFGAAEMKEYGKRKYYGYVARLIYDGKVMDESSFPQNLSRCLYYFTSVYPRR